MQVMKRKDLNILCSAVGLHAHCMKSCIAWKEIGLFFINPYGDDDEKEIDPTNCNANNGLNAVDQWVIILKITLRRDVKPNDYSKNYIASWRQPTAPRKGLKNQTLVSAPNASMTNTTTMIYRYFSMWSIKAGKTTHCVWCYKGIPPNFRMASFRRQRNDDTGTTISSTISRTGRENE